MCMIYNSILGKKITLTSERKKHILIYHPDLKSYFANFKEVFLGPDEIRISKSDPKVLLFYKFFDNIKGGKYLVGGSKV